MSVDPETSSTVSIPTRPRRHRAAVGWVGSAAVVVLGLVAALRWWPNADSASEGVDFRQRYKGGALIISGGGRLPPEIRQRFVELAGGAAARIVVIPAFAADEQQQAGLRDVWRPFGVTHVRVLQADSRADADRLEFAEPLKSATGVWLSGGQQEWLAARYAGSRVEAELQALVKRGGVIGGSSAGAAVMSQVMIEQGLDTATLGTGLDLFPGAVIDQHFLKRSRLNRLLRVLESQPELIGFGIDESTALVVQVAKGRLGVLGDSYVMVCVPHTDQGPPRYETMKRGDQIDLDALRSGRARISSPQELESWLSEN
ncbi:MAG: cyanophycinase [Planctomycetaceae bacterium]